MVDNSSKKPFVPNDNKSLVRSYIQDDKSLVELCDKLAKSAVIAIDTEFVRTRTLYPKLGLLQINNGEHLALIDPIAIDDLSPFWDLLTNGDICKVLHACSEDLEVFLTAAPSSGREGKPVNLIDSQIMMSFLGHGLSMGYAAMVNHYTGIELDKSESRTDWTRRPLTERQLTYAEADVEYLFQIYPRILAELETVGWLVAAKQETQCLVERKFIPIDETQLYRNIKMSWCLGSRQLNLLQHLALWRFDQAKKRDLPLGFVAKDTTIMALAKYNPDNLGVMAKIEGIDVLDVKHKGSAMLYVLKQANKVPEKDHPSKINRLDEYPGYKQIFKQVKTFMADIALESGLSIESLASKKQINQFLTQHFKLKANESRGVADILQGWRFELFGEKLQKFAREKF